MKPLYREHFEQALTDLRDGVIDGLATWKIDRLCRNHHDLQRVWDLVQTRGVRLLSVHEQFDTPSPWGEFALRLLVNLAKLESDTISLRLRSLLEAKAKQGKPHRCGRRPLGWELDGITERPEEIKWIRWAGEQILDGRPVRAVALELNREGFTTSEGKQWQQSRLGRLLRSARVGGKRTHRGMEYPAQWRAIFNEDEHTRLREIITEAPKGTGGTPTRLLSGIATCGRPDDETGEVCGSGLWSALKGRKNHRMYSCYGRPYGHGCGRLNVVAAPLEEVLVEAVMQRHDGPGLARLVALLGQEDHKEIAAQLQADKDALVDLSNARFVARAIGDEEYYPARAALAERIEQAQAKLRGSGQAEMLADIGTERGALRTWWTKQEKAGDVEAQRALLKLCLQAVVIRPARRGYPRFDADRLDPRWRA